MMDAFDIARTNLRRGPWVADTGDDIMDLATAQGQLAVRATVGAAESVDVLPTLPDDDYDQGRLVVLTTDNQVYRSDGTDWIKTVEGDTGSSISDFIQYGVQNGSFSLPPADTTSDIDADTNPLPFWTGPTIVSGDPGVITCQYVDDADSPSGHNLRFTVASGAANDESYVEQIVPIGGTRSRVMAHGARVGFYRVTASSNNFQATLALQYLDADQSELGTESSTTASLSADSTLYFSELAPTTAAPPATARYLRIRMGVSRHTAGDTDTLTMDIPDIRIDTGYGFVALADYVDPTLRPGVLSQQTGHLEISAQNGGATLTIDSTVPAVYADALTVFWVPETTSGTPSTGYHAVYAKSDHRLYSQDDSGNEYKLSLVAGTDYQAAGAAAGGDLSGTYPDPSIAASAVTLAKMANRSTQTFIGRKSAGAGAPEELTASDAKSILSIAQADVSGLTTSSSPSFSGMTLSGQLTMSGNTISMGTGNIASDSTIGTKIGTGATHKLGFFNATPVAQQGSGGNTTISAAGSTNTVFRNTTFTGGVGTTAYTIGDIVKALKNLGFIAS